MSEQKPREWMVNEFTENGITHIKSFPGWTPFCKFNLCVIEKSAYDEQRLAALALVENWRRSEAKLAIAIEALEKIADPRKRDHQESDKYTEVGCMIHMAEETLEKVKNDK